MTASTQDQGLKVVELDEDHAKGIAFNMLFLVWQKRTTENAYRKAMATATELAGRYPEGVGVLQLLGRASQPPDAAARKCFVEFLHLPSVKHFSVTYEGVGFKAASIRAVVASVHALARPKFQHAVHTTLQDAARWHARAQEKLGRSESTGHIERMVNNLLRLHLERYPVEQSGDHAAGT